MADKRDFQKTLEARQRAIGALPPEPAKKPAKKPIKKQVKK